MLQLIITMAGFGKRFRDAGYNIPKHMINIKGKTMFEWALTSLNAFFNERFIFVTLKENNDSAFVTEKTKIMGINNIKIKCLPKVTRGQAETALLIKNLLNKDDPILIYNIDTYVEPEVIKKDMLKGEGWIPCFRAPGTHWSFVKFNKNFEVYEVTEKIRISEFASIGLYYFSSFRLFEKAYINYYKNHTLNERYIAPVYNYLIENGFRVYTTILPAEKVHVLGTPEELKEFERCYKKGD